MEFWEAKLSMKMGYREGAAESELHVAGDNQMI
jgi:hypothetical protein